MAGIGFDAGVRAPALIGSDSLLELHDPEAGLFLCWTWLDAVRQLDVNRFHGDFLELESGTEE
jgi:hypothetical protein